MQVTLQPPTPFDQSLIWKIHDAYFAARGIDAWNQGEVPFFSTSNYGSATQHARFFADVVTSQIEAGRLRPDQEVWVLEVGSGVGRFAANFLRALEISAGDAGREVFARVRYVMSDYSEKNLRQAAETHHLKHYVESGRVVMALYDLREPRRLQRLDGLEIAEPLTLVIANYVCCVVPLKNIQWRGADGWAEQFLEVKMTIEDSRRHWPVEELVDEVLSNPTRAGLVKEHLKVDYEWRARTLEQIYDKALHRDVLGATARDLPNATIGYPHGFLDFVDGITRLLAPGGVVLVNDYGSVDKKELQGLSERRPQIYGNSIANSINYAVFDAFAEVAGWHLLRSRDTLGSLHSAALRPEVPWTAREHRSFEQNYLVSRAGDDILDYSAIARASAEKKELDRALRFYRRCLEIEPESPDFHYRAADAAIDAGHYDMAIKYLEAGRAFNTPDSGLDFEFQLGRATCLLQDYKAAIAWYELALKNENHPTTWTNLGVLYESDGRLEDAYRCYKTAMQIDPSYERARERMTMLRDLFWRKKLEELDGPNARDPLAPPPPEGAAPASKDEDDEDEDEDEDDEDEDEDEDESDEGGEG
ncbi:MAG: SAM-dependent methyltransferase [Deltaproteobacteria bacterium]|nr:SAM-dependent methyltransferase [Deltaproteobacteria bacterium]